MKKNIAPLLLTVLFTGAVMMGARQLIGLHLQDRRQQGKFDVLAERRADSTATQSGQKPSVPSVFLSDEYPDMAAWIKIDGTKVDYPVMQTPDKPNYYLRRDIDGAYSSYGVPYLQENCELNESDNLIIHGHAFKNGDMFGALKNYTEKSFCDAHGMITLSTQTETHEYRIFAVLKVNVEDENCFAYWSFTDGDATAYADFVKQAKLLSFYDTGITPEYGQQLLTLSTCEYTYANGRLAVLAVRTT